MDGGKRHRSRIRDQRQSAADEELVNLSFMEKKIAERGMFRNLERTIEKVSTIRGPTSRRNESHKTRTEERSALISQRSGDSYVNADRSFVELVDTTYAKK